MLKWMPVGLLAFALAGCLSESSKPQQHVTLPAFCTTPDGMAIDPQGRLVIACPNFADPSKPACLLRMSKPGEAAYRWVNVPAMRETGVAAPMGIDFGPEGELYVCDNQGWSGTPQGQFKGRLLKLTFANNTIETITVVASGMEHPNGVRVRGNDIYVTQSMLSKVKTPSGKLVSAVYRFKRGDKNIRVSNTLNDATLLVTFETQNPFCQYGVDGLVFDSKGNLFVGNFGDGTLHKLTFDAAGKVTSNTLFAKTDFDARLDPKKPGFLTQATRAKMRTTDGLCIDAQDNLYVADFSNNAIAKVTPAGILSVLWQNGDTDGSTGLLNQPGEPIVWKNQLIVSNFDAVFGKNHPDKVNTQHDTPCTLSVLPLK